VTTRNSLLSLCGAAGGNAGAPVDPTSTTAAAACNVATKVIDASGSTAEELADCGALLGGLRQSRN
jgi:hypothetical protein